MSLHIRAGVFCFYLLTMTVINTDQTREYLCTLNRWMNAVRSLPPLGHGTPISGVTTKAEAFLNPQHRLTTVHPSTLKPITQAWHPQQYNHRVWVLSANRIYLGLSFCPCGDFVFSLTAILLHFLGQRPTEANHKHLHVFSHCVSFSSHPWHRSMAYLLLLNDRTPPYSESACPWGIYSSTLLVRWHTPSYNSSTWGSDTLSWPLWTPIHTCHTLKHIYINKKTSF